jgi:ABC-2 type transport system ATP-binding protein/lipopolysaccharide transport system ATP-binding protein
MTKKEVDEKYDQIVEFSELKEFIDTPIKHYSSGMYMRLGFSVAIHTNPNILLVDEILAVGDSNFQEKSFNKMREFKKKGITIVYISHDLESVERFCDKAIYIKDGKLEAMGETKDVADRYIKDFKIDLKSEAEKKEPKYLHNV